MKCQHIGWKYLDRKTSKDAHNKLLWLSKSVLSYKPIFGNPLIAALYEGRPYREYLKHVRIIYTDQIKHKKKALLDLRDLNLDCSGVKRLQLKQDIHDLERARVFLTAEIDLSTHKNFFGQIASEANSNHKIKQL
eukprot:snap_masked-scaffold_2-processed-gene-5.37-mRNA-1 protein AED:1.00 eAED:1.00 QI:0/-1/0/0/-1/1/1/0/134